MRIIEAHGMNERCISDQLFIWYNKNRQTDDSRDDFYCGIAQNPEERISDHERENYDGREITIAVAYKCDSMEIAAEVESIMHNCYKMDYGNPPHDANGAVERTKYVYLYRKP